MHIPGAEAAGWGILLPLLVKTYAKAELLPEGRGAHAIGAGGRWARPEESIGSSPRHRNAYGIVLYSNGDTAKPYYPLNWKSKFQPALLSEDTFQGKGVGSSYYALSAETFFPSFKETVGITHNANNSGAAG